MFQQQRVSSPVPFVPGSPWTTRRMSALASQRQTEATLEPPTTPPKPPKPTSTHVINMANPPVASGNPGTNRKKLLIAQFIYENPELDLQDGGDKDKQHCCESLEDKAEILHAGLADVCDLDVIVEADDVEMPPLEGDEKATAASEISFEQEFSSDLVAAINHVARDDNKLSYAENLDNPQPLKATKSPLAVLDTRYRQVQSVAPFIQTIPPIGDDILHEVSDSAADESESSSLFGGLKAASKPTPVTSTLTAEATSAGMPSESTPNSSWLSSFYQQYEYFSQTCNQFSALAEKSVKPKDIKSLFTVPSTKDDSSHKQQSLSANTRASNSRQAHITLPSPLIQPSNVGDPITTAGAQQAQPTTASWHPLTGYAVDAVTECSSTRPRRCPLPQATQQMQLNLAVGTPIIREPKSKNSGGFY